MQAKLALKIGLIGLTGLMPGCVPKLECVVCDGLRPPMANWSWQLDNVRFDNAEPVFAGTSSILIDFAKNSGFSVFLGRSIPGGAYEKITFSLNPGDNKKVILGVSVQVKPESSSADPAYQIVTATKENEWNQIEIPFEQFDKLPTGISRINIVNESNLDLDPIYIDNLKLQ